MKLTVNGQTAEAPHGQTVRELVEKLGLGGRAVAVELNRKIVRKRDHDGVRLAEGDSVEIVTLVGGG